MTDNLLGFHVEFQLLFIGCVFVTEDFEILIVLQQLVQLLYVITIDTEKSYH